MNDGFDELVSGVGSGGEHEYETLWELLSDNYSKVHEGVLVQGMIMVEVAMPNGDRHLRYCPSPDLPPWTAMGMVASIKSDYQASDIIHMIAAMNEEGHDDE